MPRPKRTKVAPSEPAVHVAKPTISTTTEPQESQDSSERAITTSDDSEGLITKNPTGVNRRGVARQEVTMSGALGSEDVAAARLKPPRARKRAALSRIAREGDHARAIEALKARRDAALAAERLAKEHGVAVMIGAREAATRQPAVVTNTTSVSVSKLAPANQASAPPRRESSVLADFKRRPRQPSLLQMVQAQHKQPEAEDSGDDDSLNDFQPDDESTPFMKSKSQLVNGQSTPSASAPSLLQSRSSRKRKLGSPEPEIQVPASQPSPSQPSSPPLHTQTAEANPFDIPADEDAREPSLPLVRSTQLSSQRDQSNLAPPQSSSPPPEPLPLSRNNRSRAPLKKSQHQRPTLPKMKLATKPQFEHSPPPSPMSSISSHPSPIRSPQKAPLKPLTTASLQNLLPRRHIRPRDKEATAFDIPSSSDVELSEDQDELSFHNPRKPKAKKSAATPKPKAGKTVTKPTNGRVSNTYGKKKVVEVSDNESSEGEAMSGGEGEAAIGGRKKGGGVYGQRSTAAKEEMRRLAQKFREVDDWALEIEDVTPHSGSSQMVDAR